MSDRYFENYDNSQEGSPPSKPPLGGEPPKNKPAEVNVYSQSGEKLQGDLRARIRVPKNYIKSSTIGSERNELSNGIIFPYTPQITYDYKADYAPINAVHSNYTQYFYKNSSVGSINITARFTVQNSKEAKVYLATKHLLSALTKMPYGSDFGAGSGPPVCRMDAYGPYMIKNVPIVITNFRVEFPADVDYFDSSGFTTTNNRTDAQLAEDLGLSQDELISPTPSVEDSNFVPVISNFIIACQPLYSRNEMLNFNVRNFIENYNNNTKYL